MLARPALALAALLLLVPLTAAHVYNHEDKHELCEVYGDPHSHYVGDGHAHVHDDAAAAALHDHDPCKQNRMDYPSYENNRPLSTATPPVEEIDPEDILFDDGDPSNTEAFVGGEYYRFPIPQGQFKIDPDGIAVTSDLVASGMGFPGSGTPTDPYIVEGYLIKGGNMLFKDTSKCFVIRNNILVNDPKVVVGPVIPDPGSIIFLPNLTPYWEAVKAAAEDLRAEYLDLSATWDALWQTWQDDKAAIDAQKAQWDQQLAAYQAQLQQWLDDFAAFEAAFVQSAVDIESAVDDYEAWAQSSGFSTTAQPTKGHSPYIDYVQQAVQDMAQAQPAYHTYMGAVQTWLDNNPPPQDPPPGSGYTAEDWYWERQNYQAYQNMIQALVDDYYTNILPTQPDEVAYQQFLADKAQFESDRNAWITGTFDPFMVDYNAFMADYNAFQADFDQVWAETGADIAAADTHFLKVAAFDWEYVGQLGAKTFNDLDELLDWALETVYGIVDPLIKLIDDTLHPNPNLVVQNNGRLILDWNGQCIHAYNNVINDLRVNQNNDRTGYATGGVIEDNRIFVVGQIRHYDGIFRQNEVGNRAHLYNLVDPRVTPSPATPAQAMNNDGANQGWYYENTIYGNVDLDFHGHHHSAGFFAPTSHYHGSTRHVAYMQTAGGTCTATHHDVDHMKANGPHKDYPQDNDIEVLGTTVLAQPDDENCLPHQDHGKRWTSVFFNDNVVIDPNGVGVRFEDRNHRADDEQANSENLRELKSPHFHQKWVQMEDNVVVGKLFVDVLNAAGTDLWTDDWSEVQNPPGAGRIAEALQHPGAEVVNSHPYRNDAWLDIQRNHIFLTQSTGILVADADELTLFQLKDNRGYGLPKNYVSQESPESLLAWFKAAPSKTADTVWSELQGWNGQDRGVQTLAVLSNVRDQFRVEHCGQTARGLDHGITATDRIYNDGVSIVASCGGNDWGTSSGVNLAYTPAPTTATPCTDQTRAATAGTDDFYITETTLGVVDGVNPAAVCGAL